MRSLQSHEPARLRQNARIAVIGGGPAGTGFALAALQIAAEMDLRLGVSIFARKDLSDSGPSGCNMCAGILSRRAVQGSAYLGIALPPEIILAHLRFHRIHWGGRGFPIRPPQPDRQALSVYPAGGPRRSSCPAASGLDAYVLMQAELQGARMVQKWVKNISFEPLPRVYFAGRSESFDLVVLATGVNSSGLKPGGYGAALRPCLPGHRPRQSLGTPGFWPQGPIETQRIFQASACPGAPDRNPCGKKMPAP